MRDIPLQKLMQNLYESGEYFASTCYIPAKEDAEDVKHAVNYARTIALASFIGLVVD